MLVSVTPGLLPQDAAIRASRAMTTTDRWGAPFMFTSPFPQAPSDEGSSSARGRSGLGQYVLGSLDGHAASRRVPATDRRDHALLADAPHRLDHDLADRPDGDEADREQGPHDGGERDAPDPRHRLGGHWRGVRAATSGEAAARGGRGGRG